jgi:hypothetical protein
VKRICLSIALTVVMTGLGAAPAMAEGIFGWPPSTKNPPGEPQPPGGAVRPGQGFCEPVDVETDASYGAVLTKQSGDVIVQCYESEADTHSVGSEP